jgi:hypothetical protein
MTTTTTTTQTPPPPPSPPPSAVVVVSDESELKAYGVLRIKLPDSFDCQKWAAELSQVTPEILAGQGDGEYAFYRNILEEPDFPLSLILEEGDIGAAIIKHFEIESLSEIRLDDAFCIHYDNATQDDTSGARHVDPSDVTVNLCLEKSEGVKDSHVLFYGTQKLDGVQGYVKKDADTFEFAVEQVPGYATLHWGIHPHETMAMTGEGGCRTNIVMTYCYRDSSRSDVASRPCYG